MSNWLDEIGSQKFSDKEFKIITKFFTMIAEENEDEIDEDFVAQLSDRFDIAIYNITELKKSLQETFNGR